MYDLRLNRRINFKIKPFSDCCGYSAGETAECASEPTPFNFLNADFKPIWVNTAFQDYTEQELLNSFCNSLEIVTDTHNLNVNLNTTLDFPHNIAQTIEDLNAITTNKLEFFITKAANNELVIAAAKYFSPGNSLYYIPIKPLVAVKQIPEKKETFRLLASVLAYTHLKLEIPHYHKDGYVSGAYEMIKDSINNGEDDEEKASINAKMIQELTQIDEDGISAYEVITDKKNLNRLSSRIKTFKPVDEDDEFLLRVATEAERLLKEDPNHSIMEKVDQEFYGTLDRSETVEPDLQFSFIWSHNDSPVYNWLLDYVENDIAEKQLHVTPVEFHIYDTIERKFNYSEVLYEKTYLFLCNLCELLIYSSWKI